MGKLYIYSGIVIAAIAIAALIYYEGKDTGGTKVELKHERANNEAKKRKEAVKPADSVSTAERLRTGSF